TDAIAYTVTPTGSFNGTQWLLAGSSGTTAGVSTLPVSIFSSTLPAGTYTGSLSIAGTLNGNAVANSPVVIPVTLQVTSGSLTLSATQLNFTYTVGAASPQPQTVTVGSSTTQSLVFTPLATSSATNPWLSVSPTSGNTTGSGTLTISVDGTKLTTPGTYNGSITVTSPGAGNSPATVNVQVVVSPGTISAPTTTLSFVQLQGGAAPAAQTIAVTSSPASLPFTVTASTTPSGGTWLSATPASGNAPASVSVSVNAGTLAPGQYAGQVVIASAGANGSPITVPVVLNVLAPSSLTVSPSTLNFAYTVGLQNPAAQTITIGSAQSVPFSATVSSTATWLSVSPSSGVTPATPSASVNPTGLAAGSYAGTITITSPNSLNPVAVNVNLTVTAIPKPVITAVANAGSYAVGSVSPGENIVIFGTGIGPADLSKSGLINNNTAFPTATGNTSLLLDCVAAAVPFR